MQDFKDLSEFELSLGHKFKNLTLLQSALTHPSYFRDTECPYPFQFHFQRLEFLGDAILGAILAQQLFHLFPRSREGYLSTSHSVLVRKSCLTKLAKNLNLSYYLRTESSIHWVDSILEDAIEALVGSIYLDSNFEVTRNCVLPWFGNIKATLLKKLRHNNPKGQLQEKLGSTSESLRYELLDSQCTTHQHIFKVGLYFGNKFIAEGEGMSKKAAEVQAAIKALKQFQTWQSPNKDV